MAEDYAPLVKCLVWDLDQTLWQGTLLEDGEVAVPDAVRAVVRGLDERGILQSVASRNDHEHAWARLEALGLAEYFLCPQIGWGRKSDAVRAVADRLGFAESAMAFIDDSPAERAEVSYHLPAVRTYPAEEAVRLLELAAFDPPVVTADARRRRAMYREQGLREAGRTSFAGPEEDFLRSLELVMTIARATPDDVARVEELTMRTSQMNATGVYFSAETLLDLLADPGHEVLVTTLTDRFGAHGAVGVTLLERHAGTWHLKLLATSCRVVPYGVGAQLLRWLSDRAAAAGVHLIADFRATDRNRMMEVAYRFAGFGGEACACRAALADTDAGGVQRLHLVPCRMEPPATMTVLAPGDARGDLVSVWG